MTKSDTLPTELFRQPSLENLFNKDCTEVNCLCSYHVQAFQDGYPEDALKDIGSIGLLPTLTVSCTDLYKDFHSAYGSSTQMGKP